MYNVQCSMQNAKCKMQNVGTRRAAGEPPSVPPEEGEGQSGW